MNELRIEQQVLAEKGIGILRLHGPLSPSTVPQFSDALQQLFDQNIFKLVLDLIDVDYISSGGVGALISALTTAQSNSGDVVLIHPKPKVLELFGLVDLFHFATDPQSAAALF